MLLAPSGVDVIDRSSSCPGTIALFARRGAPLSICVDFGRWRHFACYGTPRSVSPHRKQRVTSMRGRGTSFAARLIPASGETEVLFDDLAAPLVVGIQPAAKWPWSENID